MTTSMKNIIIILTLFLIPIMNGYGQEGSMDGFFKKYQDDESFTVVNISPKMFSVISGMDIESMDPEMKEILKNISGMKILTKGVESKEDNKYYNEAIEGIRKNGLEELMTIKEKGHNVKIYGKSNDDLHLTEVVMVTGNASNFVLMQVLGRLTLDQLSRLNSTLNPKSETK